MHHIQNHLFVDDDDDNDSDDGVKTTTFQGKAINFSAGVYLITVGRRRRTTATQPYITISFEPLPN